MNCLGRAGHLAWFGWMLGLGLLSAMAPMAGCTSGASAPRPRTPFAAVVGPLIIAHRGGALEAPENTLASVRHGIASGSDWQEVDLMLTRDEQVVLFHDESLERTTGGRGLLEERTLDEIRGLSAGRPGWSLGALAKLKLLGVTPVDFEARYDAERVPTLDEALSVPESRLMLELKKTSRGKQLVHKVLEAIRRSDAHDRVAIASFEPSLLWEMRDREPSLPLIGLAGGGRQVEQMLGLPISVLAVSCDLVDHALQVSPAGLAVWCWTVYSVEMAEEAVARGVHGLITDIPSEVVKAVRPHGDALVGLR